MAESSAWNDSLVDVNSAYKTFTGSDIVAYINHVKLATLQAITVSVTREVQPIYVMGSPNPKAFAKGKRGIAGSLVFSQFDRDALVRGVFDYAMENTKTIAGLPVWTASNKAVSQGSATYKATPSNGSTAANIHDAIIKDAEATRLLVGSRAMKYADQIPPFDVTITMVNEEGAGAVAAILGIQLVNQGFGWSLDDVSNDVAYTFVCREVEPLTSLMATSYSSIANSLYDL